MDKRTDQNPRCPHCGATLERSDLPERGYKWQCRDCDEDFFDFEAVRENKKEE